MLQYAQGDAGKVRNCERVNAAIDELGNKPVPKAVKAVLRKPGADTDIFKFMN
jgi:hypothetical protein